MVVANKKFRIKTGDMVKVIAGKSKGHVGKVTKMLRQADKVVVEGANIVKKHVKPSAMGPGGITQIEMPIHISNVAYYIEEISKCSKITYKFLEDNKKVRVAKATKEVI